MPEADCTDYEKQLGYIPLVQDFKDYTFGWYWRKLLAISYPPEAGMPQGTVCMIYVCVDKRSKLPHNSSLEDAARACGFSCGVFGDAYIFRAKSEPTGSGGAQYLHINEEFSYKNEKDILWGKALQTLYEDVKREGRLEEEGMTTETKRSLWDSRRPLPQNTKAA